MTRPSWLEHKASRVVIALVGAALAINVALAFFSEATQTPSGPPSSSYATSPEGVAAYAELLRANGYRVHALREDLRTASMPPTSTVVVIDAPDLPAADARALHDHLIAGGRVVAGTSQPIEWLTRVLDRPPGWSPGAPGIAAPLAPVPEVEAVAEVEADGRGTWGDAGAALPAMATSAGTIMSVADVGSGRLVLLADTTVLQNRLLDERDNASLALAMAGDPGGEVVFVESVHGYGPRTGLAALPARWKTALGGLAIAALLFVIARGRRLGPPEATERDLPPPRRAYVESLGGILARTRRPNEALEPVRRAIRARLAARTQATGEPDVDSLRRAAETAGLPEGQVRVVIEGIHNDSDVLAVGRALAKLERERV